MLMLMNDNGIILLCICRMLLTFQSAFSYYFSCQTVKQTWRRMGSGLRPGLVWDSQEAGCHSCEGSGFPLTFLLSLRLLLFLSIFHKVLSLFWSSLLLPWSFLHIMLCSLEESYYRKLINNKFQCSDRSIGCMISRGHYGK